MQGGPGFIADGVMAVAGFLLANARQEFQDFFFLTLHLLPLI
jgi:hypothetical protein